VQFSFGALLFALALWAALGAQAPVAPASNHLVYLVAPVKDPAGTNAQMVVGGLTEDPAHGPGLYSAKDSTVFQISRQEQSLEILRNVTTTPADRVKAFSFKAGGGSYAKLFDGTEKMLSWDNILWMNRSILAK